MSLGTHLVEQALARWLLEGPDVGDLVHIRRFLRPDDFADARYASVYSAALAALDDSPGSAQASGALDPALMQVRVITSDEFLRSLRLRPDDAPVELRPVATAARAWARDIVEDAARRRLTALSFRVDASPGAGDPAEELEYVRVQLDALLSQLQEAHSRVAATGVLVVPNRLPDWRDKLSPLDRAHPLPGEEAVPDDAELHRMGARVLAMCLQFPDVATDMVRAGEVSAADVVPDALYVEILSAVSELVREGKNIEPPSLYRRVERNVAKAGRRPPHLTVNLSAVEVALETARWATLPESDPLRAEIHRFVARVRSHDAAEMLRALAADATKPTAVVVRDGRSSVHRARAAVRRVPVGPLVPPAPRPAQRSEGPHPPRSR